MKFTSDYKKEALAALRDHWPSALIVSFIITLVGGGFNTVDINITKEVDLKYYLNTFHGSKIWPVLSIFLIVAATVSLIITVVSLAIGGALRMGSCIFNLNLIDNNKPQVGDVFSQLPRFIDGFCMQFLMGLYTFLWALLFVIPGIIKAHAYRMTPFILAENPGMKPSRAIEKSKTMMNGHKMDLFSLRLSFIGWSLLCSLPGALIASIITANIMRAPNPFLLLGILPLIVVAVAATTALNTYMAAADAAFYRDLSTLIPADNVTFTDNNI